jgi:3-hydroxyisobutyrate dehydrogenase
MNVGFIGLGNIGSKLAGTLIRNNIPTYLNDLEPLKATHLLKLGGVWAENPSLVAKNCDVIITCLPSPEISALVAEASTGILAGISKGKIWIEMSTTQTSEVIRLAKKFLEKGVLSADCPVSGGCHRADTGNISIFAGCERSVFEKIKPILCILGQKILHTGNLGTASTLKVMTNFLATTHLIACCEALIAMKASGIDLAVTYEAIKISSGNSFVHETESQVILNGSRDINFTLDLVQKDIALFQKIATENFIPLEISPVLNKIISNGIKELGPRANSPSIVSILERITGLEIVAPGFPTEIKDHEPETFGYEVHRS